MRALRRLLFIPALTGLLALGSGPAFAADPEEWVPSGQLGTARASHVATLLVSGQVLVAGGRVSQSDGSVETNTAELYDPAAHTWASTGSMATPRAVPMGVLLAGGDFLVIGGFDGNAVLKSAERYDAAAGTWSAAGSMGSTHHFGVATLLDSGKVLVAGGEAQGDPISSAELYDPVTNVWTPTGAMATPRSGATATLLPDGKVLVAGGSVGETGGLINLTNTAELYDPAAGTWTATASMHGYRYAHTATTLDNGTILVVGGYSGSSSSLDDRLVTAELYDPATATWTLTGDLSTMRGGHTAQLTADGRVLVDGGADIYDAEVYDPGSGTWSISGRRPQPTGATMTLLPDGTILSAGGELGPQSSNASYLWPAPQTTITDSPATPTTSTTATFSFSATDPNASFECALDGSPFTACTSPLEYADLGDGSHTVHVRATSAAGLAEQTPASKPWVVDTTAPTPAVRTPKQGAATADTTPTIGVVGGGSTGDLEVTVWIYAGTTTAGTRIETLHTEYGQSGLAVDSVPLNDGTYTVEAQQRDYVGHLGHSAPVTFRVDTVAPVVRLTAPAQGGEVAPGIPTFAGTAGTAPGDLRAITVRLYGGPKVSGTELQSLQATAAGGAWSVAGFFAITEGTYTAQAEQNDTAGNTRTTAPSTFRVVAPPPGTPPQPAPPGGGGQPPVSPPLVVSNVISFGRTTVARDGTITLRLVAPGPGTFAVRGTVRVGGTVKYGSGAAVAVGAGTVKVRVRPGKAGRRALRRGRKLRVRLAIMFNPLGGTSATVTKTVTVRPVRR